MQNEVQVGIVSDHLRYETGFKFLAEVLPGGSMLRVRHCIECPKCQTRYVISRAPYDNGSYLIPLVEGSGDEYILYCFCSSRSVRCRWKSTEVILCNVTKAAYERGYGTAREIIAVDPNRRERGPVDVASYIRQWRTVR